MMGNRRLAERAMKLPKEYRMIKDNQRVLKCSYGTGKGRKPCLTRIRVREVEPGFYSRTCSNCGTVWWFELIETGQVIDGLKCLRFQWRSEQYVNEQMARFKEDTVDIGIARGVA